MSARRPLDFMTVQEVAEAAGISVRRVQKLCQSGRLVSMKVAGVWLILEHSAYDWIRSRKVGRPRKGEERPRGEQLELEIDSEDKRSSKKNALAATRARAARRGISSLPFLTSIAAI